MHYYLLATIKNNTPLLTYASKEPCQEFDIVNISLRNQDKKAVVIKEVSQPIFECKSLTPEPFYFTNLQKKLARFIAQYYCSSYNETFNIFTPASINPPSQNPITIPFNLHSLSTIQQDALDFCMQKNLTLLFGDTGSGKTEVFFHLIAETLKNNKKALLLMPEISLTPQMEKRLKNAFGDIFVLWHSKLSAKKKKENLEKILSHQARIIAGARSALFLPIESLGLIIVDEEHDDAYKSQSKPKYNARDLCFFLSKNTQIKIVLASATPSATSYFIAKNQNSIFRLKGNFHQSKKTFIFDHTQEPISSNLIHHLQNNLAHKQQSIIFVPTRANFKTLLCNACGDIIMCNHCSIAMSLHAKKNSMICHYCGFSTPIPKHCPNCNQNHFSSQRIGTAQLKIELESLLPNARIAIFDKDHTNTNKQIKTLLNSLKNQEIDILIGTQMIAKGHDYHNVSLSVILGIDYILKSPDFRGTEKAFSLLYQVAGRSGRKDNGKVLIQSLNTDFLQQYLEDYELFLEYELQNRHNLYPPYKKLIMLHFSHKEEEKAKKNMQIILSILEQNCKDDFMIIGADKAGVEKIANIYRYHILLRVVNQVPTLKLIHFLQDKYPFFDADIDPLDFS